MKRRKLIHIVTFRLGDESWLQLESAAENASVKPNDWVRDLTIQTLSEDIRLRPNERLLFDQFVRSHYLLANGFQLLADEKLRPEEWKRLCLLAKEKINVISDRVLADFRSRYLLRTSSSSTHDPLAET
jgi:hypothetical protein